MFDEESKTNDDISKIAFNYLNKYYPNTKFANNEKETYAKMTKEKPKNMFLQSIRNGETEISLKLIIYNLIDINKAGFIIYFYLYIINIFI